MEPLDRWHGRWTHQLTLTNHIQSSRCDPSTNTVVTSRHKAYIDTILKTNQCTQKNVLISCFYKDNGPDTSDAKTGPNSGLFNRYLATVGGNIVDLERPLFVDLFQQSKLLVYDVSIGIKLWPSVDAFRLISDSLNANQKVQIVDVRFKLCVQRLNGGLLVAHETLFHEQPATYPYLQSEIKTACDRPGTSFKDWCPIKS